MYPIIKIHINNNNLIDVINFLDQNNVIMEYNRNELYRILIEGKKYEEICFFLDRGTDINDFLNLCTENNNDVINFLIEKMLDESEDPGEFFLKLIIDSNYKIISRLACIYKFRTDDIWNYSYGKPLRLAVRKGKTSIINLLFSLGSKVSECNIDPIIDALITGKPDLIPLLLEKGSNIANIKPEHLEICLKKKYRLCVNFIYDKIAKQELPHFEETDITKCFLEALRTNNDELANVLIKNYQVDLNNDILSEYISNPKNKKIIRHYNFLKKKIKNHKKKSGSEGNIENDDDTIIVDDSSDYDCINKNSSKLRNSIKAKKKSNYITR